MIIIYHNPRCRKSRDTLEILETKKADYKVIKYLDTPLSEEKLGKIIKLLKIRPIELIRKNESIWKENFKDLDFSDEELIQVMAKYPKLIERPIVINGNKAVIGRPPELILDIL
ncbi:MAG: arsenate reductase (glutaredoxin) [Bacteroidia bacterium]|nr:arsenate reductase (glutaredoxin) [Bacteroidia bacterium]NND25900.1 arsenate reductase (glutaredoxin) [Flavobacteriaceae bacterium]MBT8277969.1 arsenate reductase (glutaredoxin) [Bacteroidia bacterium]NNK60167.1 arsenate reductase (glutaredoxin) [Flavobacteriaceae bacterium]NNL32889.1 arsenate reductase (glutaredoxin) [Flavobacteriaceae bacterium]